MQSEEMKGNYILALIQILRHNSIRNLHSTITLKQMVSSNTSIEASLETIQIIVL